MTDYGTIHEPATATPAVEGVELAKHAAPTAATAELSPLERMRQEAKRSTEKILHYPVNGRPGMTLAFTNAIDPDDMKRYQRNGQGNRKRPEDADQVLISAQVLQEANRGIFIDGKQVISEDGDDWTLGHKEFIALYGDMGAVIAIKQLLGGPQVLSMAAQLVQDAGYGAEFDNVDPTKPLPNI